MLMLSARSTHINEKEAIKVLIRLGNEGTIRLVDAGVTVVGRWIGLGLHTLGCSLLETFLAKPLKGSQGPSASFDGVRRGDKIRSWFSDVGGWVGVLECLLAGVHRPRCDVNLLALGDIEGFQEGVHILPAVELSQTSELCLGDTLESVACAIAVDELLDMSRLDFAAVVDDFTGRVDQSLGKVKSGVVNF
jgi:hypothetical protein